MALDRSDLLNDIKNTILSFLFLSFGDRFRKVTTSGLSRHKTTWLQIDEKFRYSLPTQDGDRVILDIDKKLLNPPPTENEPNIIDHQISENLIGNYNRNYQLR
ncbi:MAG: hypothetical protein M1365_05250 [Actinobacteria bacterium]|nr:hypothetical protein [Actinomycetota bacterium]